MSREEEDRLVGDILMRRAAELWRRAETRGPISDTDPRFRQARWIPGLAQLYQEVSEAIKDGHHNELLRDFPAE